jgi:hypothetical protein
MSARPIVDQIAHRLADTANWSRKCHGCGGPSSDQSGEVWIHGRPEPRLIADTTWRPATDEQ